MILTGSLADLGCIPPLANLKVGYEEMVQKVWPILSDASGRGIPIDTEERAGLIVYLETERKRIYAELQAKVPDEVRKIHPVEGYKVLPPLLKRLYREWEDGEENRKRVLESGRKVIDFDAWIEKKSYSPVIKEGEPTKIFRKLRMGHFQVLTKAGEVQEVDRWCWVEDFNPNTPGQIIKYMKYKGHKVPVKLDGNETSEAKELERLAIQTKDTMYDGIIEYRQINKMLTNDIPNWEPSQRTGAVHTEFGFLPATGQLNSRSPNVQNANKHKPLGKRFRRIIRARSYRDGRYAGRRRRLVECDYSGFHAIMLGREAQSQRYVNISRADAHSWLTSYVIGKPVEYPQVYTEAAYKDFKAKLKIIKKEYKVIRDTQSKPTILGVGLGLGPRKMYWMNRERFDPKLNMVVGIKDEGQSKKLQGVLKELLPELFEYQTNIKKIALDQTYLINRWGMIRWFFDVQGEDGEAAIAFNVQGNAHGMLRWVLRRLHEEVLYACDRREYGFDYPHISGRWDVISALERFHFINTIHDSLLFEPWEDDVEECIRTVEAVMTTPCVVLADKKVCPQGLIVGVESMVGENWAEWDEKKNTGGMQAWVWEKAA